MPKYMHYRSGKYFFVFSVPSNAEWTHDWT